MVRDRTQRRRTALARSANIQASGEGIELGRGLAAAGFRLPIIYMTGSTEPTVRARAMQAGCVAFLTKPFTPPALDEALMVAKRKSLS